MGSGAKRAPQLVSPAEDLGDLRAGADISGDRDRLAQEPRRLVEGDRSEDADM
jgi:hypothetical protein